MIFWKEISVNFFKVYDFFDEEIEDLFEKRLELDCWIVVVVFFNEESLEYVKFYYLYDYEDFKKFVFVLFLDDFF